MQFCSNVQGALDIAQQPEQSQSAQSNIAIQHAETLQGHPCCDVVIKYLTSVLNCERPEACLFLFCQDNNFNLESYEKDYTAEHKTDGGCTFVVKCKVDRSTSAGSRYYTK